MPEEDDGVAYNAYHTALDEVVRQAKELGLDDDSVKEDLETKLDEE